MSNSQLLHRRVADYLKERIGHGVIVAGSRVPAERVLAEQFDVSRVTVRRALKELEQQGLVEVIGGTRWVRRDAPAIVTARVDDDNAESIEEGATGLVSFSDLAAANGLTATSKVLRIATRPSTLDEADRLGIAPGAPIVELVRLRSLDGVPTLIDFSLIPEAPAPGLGDLDFETVSLYGTLAERYGMHAVGAECVMEARGASAEIAVHLGLAGGDPVLEIVQTTFDESDRIIQWGRSVYRGDRYRFRALLEGPAAGSSRPHRLRTTADVVGRTPISELARLYQ